MLLFHEGYPALSLPLVPSVQKGLHDLVDGLVYLGLGEDVFFECIGSEVGDGGESILKDISSFLFIVSNFFFPLPLSCPSLLTI